MNILMLTPDYPPVYGGIGTHVEFLVKKLVEYGNNITLIVTRVSATQHLGEDEKVEILEGEKLTVIDMPNCYLKNIAKYEGFNTKNYYNIEMEVMGLYGNSIDKILHYLPKREYDIIHMHDGYVGLASKILSQYLEIPVITTIHSMHAAKTSMKYYLREYAVNNSSYVIAVSQFIKDKIIQTYYVDSDKIEVIHNSIELKTLLERKKENLYKISFCGRFEEIKGVITLINTFKEVLETVKGLIGTENIILNLIGEGSLREQMIHLVESLNITEHVHFYSNISNLDVLRLFHESCCVVIPSKEEPFATVGLEAMSVKTAVIASDVGGMSEMVLHNETGYLYDVEKQYLLKEYIIDLLCNPLKARSFGEKGYLRMKKYFTWEYNIEKILKLYHSVCKDSK